MSSKRFGHIVYTLAALISAIGLAEATYLAVLSVTGASAICGGAAGCSEVLGSRYAKVGSFPVAGFGAAAYFVAFSAATFAAFDYEFGRKTFTAIVSVMLLSTFWLLYVQAFLLHAFCQYCLFSAALIFFLSGMALLAPKTPE